MNKEDSFADVSIFQLVSQRRCKVTFVKRKAVMMHKALKDSKNSCCTKRRKELLRMSYVGTVDNAAQSMVDNTT